MISIVVSGVVLALSVQGCHDLGYKNAYYEQDSNYSVKIDNQTPMRLYRCSNE